MHTLEQLVSMVQQPGDNLVDNQTLHRLLLVDAEYSRAIPQYQRLNAELERLRTYAANCGQLVKLLRSYNPALPMGAGMAAQFKEIYGRIENGG